jgi:acyl-CoA dehydrogenase
VHEWDETLTTLATSAGRDRLWTLVTTGRAKTAARPHS